MGDSKGLANLWVFVPREEYLITTRISKAYSFDNLNTRALSYTLLSAFKLIRRSPHRIVLGPQALIVE